MHILDCEIAVAGAEGFDGEVGGSLGHNAGGLQPGTKGSHLAGHSLRPQGGSLLHLDTARENVMT